MKPLPHIYEVKLVGDPPAMRIFQPRACMSFAWPSTRI